MTILPMTHDYRLDDRGFAAHCSSIAPAFSDLTAKERLLAVYHDFDFKDATTSPYNGLTQTNGEGESGVKMLRQPDSFLAIIYYIAPHNTATGERPCQLMMGIDIHTPLSTLKSNLK